MKKIRNITIRKKSYKNRKKRRKGEGRKRGWIKE